MSNTFKTRDLIHFFKKHQPITTQDFLNFYHQFNPDLPLTTLRWRIYELKRQGIIYSPKRGLYALNEKDTFQLKPTKKMNELGDLLQEKFPYVNYSIYNTNWIGNLSNHLYQTNNIIVEIDADILDVVFYFLKENYPNTFLSPEQKMYDYYISPKEENIIVTRLYVDAPLNKVKNNYHTPKIEKLIVDLLINDPIIFPVGDAEIKTIILNATNKYNINYSTLNRYAKKRNAVNLLVQMKLTGGPNQNDY